jgi:hypothetical protein
LRPAPDIKRTRFVETIVIDTSLSKSKFSKFADIRARLMKAPRVPEYQRAIREKLLTAMKYFAFSATAPPNCRQRLKLGYRGVGTFFFRFECLLLWDRLFEASSVTCASDVWIAFAQCSLRGRVGAFGSTSEKQTPGSQ